MKRISIPAISMWKASPCRGMPFVIVGHNQRIAWGFTNLTLTCRICSLKTSTPQANTRRQPDGRNLRRITRSSTSRASPTYRLTSPSRVTGPSSRSLLPGETRQIALEWLIYDHAISIPLFDLDSAQNWEQFRKALSVFATPSQNVVYGDVDGNIGYQPMGFVPVRAAGDGTVPVSGADGKHDWTGYLPFDKLPAFTIRLPESSPRPTPRSRRKDILICWPRSGSRRIAPSASIKCCKQDKKFSPADMLALQTDVTSEYDRFFAEKFVYAIDHSSKATDRTRRAADVMRGFDGRMLAESAAPTIEVNAREALWEMLLQPKLGNGDNYEWSEAAVALENIVHNQPARWLPPGYANFNDLLTAAVEKASKTRPQI